MFSANFRFENRLSLAKIVAKFMPKSKMLKRTNRNEKSILIKPWTQSANYDIEKRMNHLCMSKQIFHYFFY